MRNTGVTILFAAISAVPPVNAQGLRGLCTAVVPAGSATQEGQPLSIGATVDASTRLETQTGRAAVHYTSGLETSEAEVALFLDANTVAQVRLAGDSRHEVQVLSGSAVVIAYDRIPLIVSTPGAWVRLEYGMLAVNAATKPSHLALASGGKATRFDGQPPEQGIRDVAGGKALPPQADARNQAMKRIGTLNTAGLVRAADAWINVAEKSDLTPSVAEEEAPVSELPASYRVHVAVIQETSCRCRWRPEKEKGQHSLLLCIDTFGAYYREDTPRTALIVPSAPVAPNRPPILNVIVGR